MSKKITVHIGDQVHQVSTLCGSTCELSAQGREVVARTIIDWAAGFGDLDVTVYGPNNNPDLDAEHAEIMAAEEQGEEVP